MESASGVEDSSAPQHVDINDPNIQERLVNELKEQGIFDQLRKDCLSDVDTKPQYQNLKQRVDKTLDSFLRSKTWNAGLSKNQLRAQLRKQIESISGKDTSIERLVDQIVDPRLHKALNPEVEAMLLKYFGNSLDESTEEIQDVEMEDATGQNGNAVETESINSEPGLEGHVSPLTPGREEDQGGKSPEVEGNISPLTPSTTPPLPGADKSEPTVVNMDVEGQVEIQQSYTPPPRKQESPSYTPPPLPEKGYTPPLPASDHTTPPPGEGSLPPLPSPSKFLSQPPPPGHYQPSPPGQYQTTPPGQYQPPPPGQYQPPPPGEYGGSGEDASMSSISDTEMADVSPPRPSNRDNKTPSPTIASSPTRLIPLPDDSKQDDVDNVAIDVASVTLGQTNSSPDHITSNREDRGGESSVSDDLETLEQKKARLLMKLGEDFKLSPEEDSSDDSEGEIDTEEDLKAVTSPISSKEDEQKTTEAEKSDEEKSSKSEEEKSSKTEDEKSGKSDTSSPDNSPKQDDDPTGDEGDEKTDPDTSEGNSDDKNIPKDDEKDDNNGSGGNPEGANDDDGVSQKSPDIKDDQRSPDPDSKSFEQSATEQKDNSSTKQSDQDVISSSQVDGNTSCSPSDGNISCSPRDGHASCSPNISSPVPSRDVTRDRKETLTEEPVIVDAAKVVVEAAKVDVIEEEKKMADSPPNQIQAIRSLSVPKLETSQKVVSDSETNNLASSDCRKAPEMRKGPVTPPEPFISKGPVTPPEYEQMNGYNIPPEMIATPTKSQEEKDISHTPASPPSPFSAFSSSFRRPPSPPGLLQQQQQPGLLQQENTKSPPNSTSKHSKEKRDREKEKEREKEREKDRERKKNEKIKEQKAKLAKVEQKVKSKDKLKSDKYQDLDIFSTVKKPVTPHQPYRPATVSGTVSTLSTPSTPVSKSKRPELIKSVSRESSSNKDKSSHSVSSSGDNKHDSDRHHKDGNKHKSSRDSSHSKTPSAAKVGERRRSSDVNSDRKSSKHVSRESSKDPEQRRHSVDKHGSGKDKNRHYSKEEDRPHHHNSDRKETLKDVKHKEQHRLKDKEKERSKDKDSRIKSRRESEDKERVDVKESREKERAKIVEETKKKLADARIKKEREEKDKKEKKKPVVSSAPSADTKMSGEGNIKEQLKNLDEDEMRSLILRLTSEKEGIPDVSKEINILLNKKDTKKSTKPEKKPLSTVAGATGSSRKEDSSSSKKKLVVCLESSDENSDIEVLNDTSHKKKVEPIVEPEPEKVSTAAPLKKDSNTKVAVKDLTKNNVKSVEKPKRRQRMVVSDSENSDSSSEEEIQPKKSSTKSPKKSSKSLNSTKNKKPTGLAALYDLGDDSTDSDEYKPDDEEEKTVSPAKTMKTRGVKVNLSKLTAAELDSLDDDDESSDDDLEITVDDVDGDNIEPGKEPAVIESQILKSKVPEVCPGKTTSLNKLKSPVNSSLKSKQTHKIKEEVTSSDTDHKPSVKQLKKEKMSATTTKIAATEESVKPVGGKVHRKSIKEEVKSENSSQVTPKIAKSKIKVKKSTRAKTPVLKSTAVGTDHDNPKVDQDSFDGFSEDDGEPFDGFILEADAGVISQGQQQLQEAIYQPDNIKIGALSEEMLLQFIPETKTIEVDLPESSASDELLDCIHSKLGGEARPINFIPLWLEPHIIGAKCKPEELEMPTDEEISQYCIKQQKKAKKRGCGYDIVVEWVPDPATNKQCTKAARELRNDPFSTFFSGIDESGGKRTRRANHRYSSHDYSTSSDTDTTQNDNDQCPDTTADTGKKDVAAKTVVVTKTAVPAKPDHDTQPLPAKMLVPAQKAVADTTSDVGTVASTTSTAPSISSSSEGRVKSSKERIAMYLRTAGVERQLPDSSSSGNGAADTNSYAIEAAGTISSTATDSADEALENQPLRQRRSAAALSTKNTPVVETPSSERKESDNSVSRSMRKRKASGNAAANDIKTPARSTRKRNASKASLDGTNDPLNEKTDSDNTCDVMNMNGIEATPKLAGKPVSKRLRADETNITKIAFPAKTGQGSIVEELKATENEMAEVLNSLGATRRKRMSSGDNKPISRGDEFYGWPTTLSPLTAISSLPPETSLQPLDKDGVTFGLMDCDNIRTKILPGLGSNLEIIMSTALQKDLKILQKENKKQLSSCVASQAADGTAAVLLRPVKSDLDLRKGSDGSDSDDKGSISPVCSEVEPSIPKSRTSLKRVLSTNNSEPSATKKLKIT